MFRFFRRLIPLLLLGAACYFLRNPILRSAANLWVVHDKASPGDAIVVLGGGRDWRPFAAAEMFHSGQAPTVLVAQSKSSPSEGKLSLPSDADVNVAVLETQGVPSSHIERFGNDVSSTRDEAAAIRDWAVSHNAKTILIPTDLFHTRRVKWIFNRALEGTGVQVKVQAIEPPGYTKDDWWLHEDGFLAFQNEAVKSLYYLLRY